MEKIKEFIHRFAFLEGLVIGILICHYFYSEYRIDDIRDEYALKEQVYISEKKLQESELAAARVALKETEDYRERYFKEVKAKDVTENSNQELLVDIEALRRRLKLIEDLKWEEKWQAEKLGRISATEQLAILKERLSASEESVATADPQLINQVTYLQEENSVLKRELEELRKLYSENSESKVSTDSGMKFPVAALNGVMSTEAGDTIISIAHTLGRIEIDSFIAALRYAMSTEAADVAVKCAPYLQYPITSDQIETISMICMSTESSRVVKALINAEAKQK
jgi:hypothetical protein